MIESIVISREFAIANDGESNDRNVFSYFMTYQGGYYCNVNYLDTNPELFNGHDIVYALISLDDIVQDDVLKV